MMMMARSVDVDDDDDDDCERREKVCAKEVCYKAIIQGNHESVVMRLPSWSTFSTMSLNLLPP